MGTLYREHHIEYGKKSMSEHARINPELCSSTPSAAPSHLLKPTNMGSIDNAGVSGADSLQNIGDECRLPLILSPLYGCKWHFSKYFAPIGQVRLLHSYSAANQSISGIISWISHVSPLIAVVLFLSQNI